MACLHRTGMITDHALQGTDESNANYFWRGVCTGCNHSVVGSTTLPRGLSEQELANRLTGELVAYLNLIGQGGQGGQPDEIARAS